MFELSEDEGFILSPWFAEMLSSQNMRGYEYSLVATCTGLAQAAVEVHPTRDEICLWLRRLLSKAIEEDENIYNLAYKSPWHNVPRWRVAIIHMIANMLGVLVHINGAPYGSWRNHNWEEPDERCSDCSQKELMTLG